MGNTNVNKVLPAIDMLLVLVVVLFATAGLLRSVPQEGVDPNAYEALLAEQDRLDTEIKSKKIEANKLEQDLKDLESRDAASPETLETLLNAAGGEQERIAGAKIVISDIHEQLNCVKRTVEDSHNVVVLERKIEVLKRKIEQLEHEKEALTNQVAANDLEILKIQELQNEIDDLNKEIEQLKKKIRKVEKPGAPAPEKPSPFGGGYKGPFVPLECDDKGVVVYPDKKRVPLEASGNENEWLKQQIRKKGAAALFVRPCGFGKSYAKFYEILTLFADKEEANGKTIVLSFWPIETEEAIEKYLPKEY